MTPEISEFSYGFALTHELIGRFGTLRAAPIFPSLIEEGRLGGGYDVHLDLPGFPLYLQFKRADCMVRGTAWEYRDGHIPTLPFYRLKITERSRSAQHDLLLDLDDGFNVVFYVAPRFHTVSELDNAYAASAVEQRSFFIRPSAIGPLDNDSHHVAFSDHHQVVCSEPREVKGYRGEEVASALRERLSSDSRPLRSGPLADSLERTDRVMRSRDIDIVSAERILDGEEQLRARLPRVDPMRAAREPKTPEVRQLRTLADRALRLFNAQLFIVQDSPE